MRSESSKYQLKVKFKWLPKEFATYINVQNSLCEKCESPSFSFLVTWIVVPDPLKLIEEIMNSLENIETVEGKKDRGESLKLSSKIIQITWTR